MNVVKEIQRINKKELELSLDQKSSWHDEYRDSAYIFIGGLDYDLTEGDVLAVFSQYGEAVNINLVKDKRTKKSKGFCFLAYEDQRSTILAVDNLNGIKVRSIVTLPPIFPLISKFEAVAGRTLRVDHVKRYRRPRDENGDEIIEKGCAPKTPTPSPSPERSPSPVKAKKKQKKKHRKRDSLSGESVDNSSSPDVKRKRRHRSYSPDVKRKKKHKEKKKNKKLSRPKDDKTAKPHIPEVPHLPMGSQPSANPSYLLHSKNPSDFGSMKKPDGKNTDDTAASKEEKPKFQLGGFFDANNPFGSTQQKKTYDYRYDFGRDSYKPTRYQ